MRKLIPALAAMVAAGCGAIFNSGPANIPFSTNPSGAEIWIDGVNRGTTPTTLSLAKNRNYTIVFRKAGFQDTSTEIKRKIAGGYLILDILGGILPVIVDAATGAWYVLDTNNVNVNLIAASTAQGQLTAEQLAAVKAGVPVATFVNIGDLEATGR